MMRNLKILGLALVAMVAMSAMGVSMASAGELTGEEPKLFLHGTNHPPVVDSFGTTAGNTQCKEVTYHIGTTTLPTTTVTAKPTYPEKTAGGVQNCTALGFPATIDTNGCHFLFHITGGSSTVGDVTVQCPAGQEVTVTAIAAGTVKCTIHVPPQTLKGDPITYTNIGAGQTREVTVDVEGKEISYQHTAGTGIGACTTGSGVNGTFNGKGLLTANDDLNVSHRGIFVSHI